MNTSFKDSQTAQNLMKAFSGESQARNRYTYYTSKAKDEGYVQISKIFEETANHEKEHAKRLYKYLKDAFKGEMITLEHSSYPIMLSDSTLDNLKAAASGEYEEWSDVYPSFARIARKEGFAEIASTFEHIAVAEKNHETRYNKLIANIENKAVFKKSEVKIWKCENCGYTHNGQEAPEVCPACAHPQAYFSLIENTY